MTSNTSAPSAQSANNGSGNSGAQSSYEARLASRGTLPELRMVNAWSEIDGSIDTFVVPVFEGDNGLELAGGPVSVLDSQQEIELWKWLTSVGAQGTSGELTYLPGEILASEEENDQPTITKILAVGLGNVEDLTEEDIRQAAGNASRRIGKADTVVSCLGIFNPEAALLGHALGAYVYSGQKSQAKETIGTLVALNAEPEEAVLERVRIIAESVAFARDLVNAPANDLYPAVYAEIIRNEATAAGLDVEVLDEKQLEEQGFGGIVGVGKGSQYPPRLVRVTYTPAGSASDFPKVALVGKGITFDTGGISLKPGAKMWDMIMDMGGSAAVIAATLAAAKLQINTQVTATIPIAENMPSANATRPGDILRHYGGLTTEVLNTDAEGRLILADAIARACEDNPDYLIETATLTGAQMVALGDRTPGIMGSAQFRDRVTVLSQEVGENGWPMPLPSELGEALKSDVADLRNISESRFGGMSVAGHYLSNFVTEGVEWVHIDVAGPAYNTSSAYGYTPKRATGVPVRTIIAVLESLAK